MNQLLLHDNLITFTYSPPCLDIPRDICQNLGEHSIVEENYHPRKLNICNNVLTLIDTATGVN